MAVRRIFACMLVLGIAALGGFGVMRGIAQSEAPALQPEQLKPAAPFVIPADPVAPTPIPSAPTEFKAPEIIDPKTPPAPETLPLLTPSDPKPAAGVPISLPPAIDMPSQEKTPALPILPPSNPSAAPTQPDAVPAAQPENKFTTTTDLPPSQADAGKFAPTHGSNRVAPTVTIETIAPESVHFGQPIDYEILVKNNGTLLVSHVLVDEEIGAGAKFIKSEPAAEVSGDRVMWNLGALSSGEEKHIKVTLNPGEGDLTTKPRVTYSAETSMSVRVTRPILTVSASVPDNVQVGDDVPVQIHITNNGTGEASRIVLKAKLTDGLKHPEGDDIQALLCDRNKLAPGASQDLTLHVQAAGPGAQACELAATTEGAPKAQSQIKFDIRQPKLNLVATGPAKCVVTGEPTFVLDVSNPGTSATEPVELAVSFPEGLEFQSATDGGAYDPATRTVNWNLGVAQANTRRIVKVKAKSTVAGHMAIRAASQAGPKLKSRAEAVIQAEGVPALSFEVVALANPIEVGKETTYEIRLANTGTMQCTNIRVTAAMSDGLAPGEASTSVPFKLTGQTLVFEPIAKMPVKGEPLIIRVKAKGMMPGDQRFKVQLSCDQLKQPVFKEESTSFFQP
jgi:Domain of unknown function DUF11